MYLMNNTNTPSCLYWHTRQFGVQDLDRLVRVICIFFSKASGTAWFISLVMTFSTPMSQVLLGIGCRPL